MGCRSSAPVNPSPQPNTIGGDPSDLHSQHVLKPLTSENNAEHGGSRLASLSIMPLSVVGSLSNVPQHTADHRSFANRISSEPFSPNSDAHTSWRESDDFWGSDDDVDSHRPSDFDDDEDEDTRGFDLGSSNDQFRSRVLGSVPSVSVLPSRDDHEESISTMQPIATPMTPMSSAHLAVPINHKGKNQQTVSISGELFVILHLLLLTLSHLSAQKSSQRSTPVIRSGFARTHKHRYCIERCDSTAYHPSSIRFPRVPQQFVIATQ